MSIKGWLKEKIKNAAESRQLAYEQSSLALEVKKLTGIVVRIEEDVNQRMTVHDSMLVELRQKIYQEEVLSVELSARIEDMAQTVERYRRELQNDLNSRLEELSAEENQQLSELRRMFTDQVNQLSQMSDKIIQVHEELSLEKKLGEKTVKEVQQLRSVATTGRCVQLMEYRSMKLFMFANDLIPDKTTEEYRNSAGQIDAYSGILNGCNVLPIIFQHYWKHGLDFTFLDVGCQYGHESILAGQYIKAMGHGNRIFCFDAGQASVLTPFNLTLNDMDDLAEFHQIAIGNDQKPLLMYYEPGYSEHNRSLNPQQSAEGTITFSYPVACTTLDDFCDSHRIEGYVIAKMDTEGSEPLVVDGMKKLMDTNPVTFITEYSPSNFHPQHEKEYLNLLLQTYALIDIGALQGAESGCERQGFQIPAERLDKYVEYVKQQSSGWADILALPRNLPHIEELLELVSNKAPF